MNVLGFPINCCQGSGGGVIPANYLFNTSSIGSTTNGRFPVFDGNSLGETLVSSELLQTNLGITITNDLNVNNITTGTMTNLNATINNINDLLFNLTNIQTKV